MYNNNFFLPPPFYRRARPNYAQKPQNINNNKSTPESTAAQEENIVQDRAVAFHQDELLFEIFGLKIYFDDLLLICILIFLYQEGIKDEYLFISLILLLLS